MLLSHLKKYRIIVFVAAITVLSVFVSCQKELSGEGIIIDETTTDLTSKTISSVSGFVTDENEAAVQGALVQCGTGSTTTDQFGYFRINNTPVVQNAAVVSVIKPGYFKCIKTWLAKTGFNAFFRIKLLPKNVVGNIDAASGGTVKLPNGLSISLPPNAVVNALTNAIHTGSVNVTAHSMTPTANDLHRTMPGDLRGLDSVGFMKTLTNYSMAVIELTGSSGELLQMASGKKAILNFLIPGTLAARAPDNIPLWYFDETTGLWKQQGTAVKSGNNYTGQVSHFSFWNCGLPADDFVQFNSIVIDAAGKPIANASVRISNANSPGWSARGYTDSSGHINGAIPANTQLELEVLSDNVCNAAAYSKIFSTADTDITFGNISIAANTTAALNGKITNCNNTAVSNGFVILKNGIYNYRAEVNTDGAFSFNNVLCNGNEENIQLIVIDNAGLQQGNILSHTLLSGVNAVGTVSACGIVAEEFINYSINGTNYTITPPGDSMIQFFLPRTSIPAIQLYGSTFSGGTYNVVNIYFTQPGIATNSTQRLLEFNATNLTDTGSGNTILTPVPVNITEYGALGDFIAGNFTGTLIGPAPANAAYNITCTFRIRRNA